MNLDVFKEDGVFKLLALDHRNNFKAIIANEADAVLIKKEIIAASLDLISGLLIDFDLGLPAYFDFRLQSPKPFLLPGEKSGYTGTEDERVNELIYTPTYMKEQGALGAKLLIYYNRNNKVAAQQREKSKYFTKMCTDNDFPLFLEIITYGDTTVKQAVGDFLEAGIMPAVYKLQYPGSSSEAQHITETLGEHKIPWVLLSAAAEFDVFLEQAKEVAHAGCSGFLAGRSLWKEGAALPTTEERTAFFNTTLRDRFNKISECFASSLQS